MLNENIKQKEWVFKCPDRGFYTGNISAPEKQWVKNVEDAKAFSSEALAVKQMADDRRYFNVELKNAILVEQPSKLINAIGSTPKQAIGDAVAIYVKGKGFLMDKIVDGVLVRDLGYPDGLSEGLCSFKPNDIQGAVKELTAKLPVGYTVASNIDPKAVIKVGYGDAYAVNKVFLDQERLSKVMKLGITKNQRKTASLDSFSLRNKKDIKRKYTAFSDSLMKLKHTAGLRSIVGKAAINKLEAFKEQAKLAISNTLTLKR